MSRCKPRNKITGAVNWAGPDRTIMVKCHPSVRQ